MAPPRTNWEAFLQRERQVAGRDNRRRLGLALLLAVLAALAALTIFAVIGG